MPRKRQKLFFARPDFLLFSRRLYIKQRLLQRML